MAEEADVDLVEVAPNAQPPVCRLMDYGKFRYQEQKKAQEVVPFWESASGSYNNEVTANAENENQARRC